MSRLSLVNELAIGIAAAGIALSLQCCSGMRWLPDNTAPEDRVQLERISADDRASLGFVTKQARARQLGLTGLMLVDTAQTVTIGRSSECLFEANPIAAAVFGSRTPSPERVLITNAIYILGHWALASYLDRKAEAAPDLSVDVDTDMARRKRWGTLRSVYQFATALGHGIAVGSNASRGIKPFSSYECAR